MIHLALLPIFSFIVWVADLCPLLLLIYFVYCLLSTILLFYPLIYHKKQIYKEESFNNIVNSNKVFVIAHRGGGWQGAQETMELFAKTDKNSDMFELDVWLTNDDKPQLVVHHDKSTIRISGKDMIVSETKFADLPCFKDEYQTYGGPILKTNNEKICLLQEVFQKYPNKLMTIEIKNADDRLEEAFEIFDELMKKYNMQDKVVWGIWAQKKKIQQKVKEVKLQYSQIPMMYSQKGVTRIVIQYLTGILPFVRLQPGVFSVIKSNEYSHRQQINVATTQEQKKSIDRYYNVIYPLLLRFSNHFVPHLKKRGIMTFVFTVNYEEEFESVLKTGCSGIMSDQTQRLYKYLKNKNLIYDPAVDGPKQKSE